MCTGVPPLSFASASMRTVQVVGSTKTLTIGAESGPGLIRPLTFFPSQFITSVIWVRWVEVGPQSPVQVPVRGWPCWATPTAVRQSAAKPSRDALLMSSRYTAADALGARVPAADSIQFYGFA